MRLKTTKYEILIAPDNEFILIVVQGQKNEGKEEEEAWDLYGLLIEISKLIQTIIR